MKPARRRTARATRAPISGGAGWRNRPGLVRALEVAAALTILIFIPSLHEAFDPAKAAVVRVFGLGLGAACLLSAALDRGRPPWQALDATVLAWLAIEVVASLVSAAPAVSILGDRAQHEGLLTSLGYAGLYLGVRTGVRSRLEARSVLDVLLIATLASCLYALVQALGADPFHWSRIATFGDQGALRPFGTLGHANTLGVVVAAALPLVVARLLEGRRAWWVTVCGAVLALVTAITLSRAAWLGACAGLVVTLTAGWIATGPRRTSLRGLAGAAAVVAGVALLAITRIGPGRAIAARLAGFFDIRAGSSASRLEIWRSALAMWHDRPWIGHGPDTFAMVFPRFQSPAYWRLEWGAVPEHAHSIYLHALATRGLMGLIAGVLWGGATLLAAGRAWQRTPDARPLVAGLAGALMSLAVAGAFGALGIAGALIVVLASALLASLAELPATDLPPGQRDALPRVAWKAAAAVGILAAIWSGMDLQAESAASAAETKLDFVSGPYAAPQASSAVLVSAEMDARTAVSLAPSDDRFAALRARSLYLLASEGSTARPTTLREAEDAARRAVAIAPLRSANMLVLAQVLSLRARGDSTARTEAERAWNSYAAMAPWDALGLTRWAEAEMDLGDPRAALGPAERAARIYPRQGPLLFGLSGIQDALKDTTGEVRTLRQAVDCDWPNPELRQQAVDALKKLEAAQSNEGPTGRALPPVSSTGH